MILRASVEDTPETTGRLAKKLAVFRNTLIEVDCDVDNGLYKWKPTRRTEWKIIEKCNQKVECTDNGHNRCLGGDAEEYGGKEVCAS